ncbi:MAG: hypothetical protein AAF304_06620 [Pseudomonadota bacterium]
MRTKLKIILIFFINVLAGYANAGGFFETGTATLTNTIDSGFWATINYTKSYVNPVVVAGPISHNNDLTLVPRVRNVTAGSFQIGMQSPCENAGSIDPPAGPCPPAGGWSTETVHYWVMEEGAWEFPDGQEVEASVENTNVVRAGAGGNSGALNPVNLTHTYATSNVNIYHTVNTFNDSSFISSTASRDDSIGNPPTPTAADNDFSLVLEGMEVNSTHGAEDIGWIAIETSSGTNAGFNYDAGRTGEDVDRHSDGCFPRGPTGLTNENIISNINTMNGNNGSEVRFCTSAGAQAGRINVHVDEDQVNDDERTGIPEAVTWFVYDNNGFGALDFITGIKTVIDDNGGTVLPGDVLTYAITLNNELNDFAQADNAANEFEDLLSSDVTYESGSATASSGSIIHNAGTIEWDGSIPASGSVTLEYKVRVNDDVCGAGGTISNQGTIFMDPNGDGINSITEVTDDPTVTIAGDIDADNLSDDDDPTQITIDCTVDLQITKDDSALTYTPGSTANYQIIVTNTGPARVTGATIADDLPDGVTMTSTWTCTPSSINSSCNTIPNTTDPISIDVDIAVGDSITIMVPVQFSTDMGDY